MRWAVYTPDGYASKPDGKTPKLKVPKRLGTVKGSTQTAWRAAAVGGVRKESEQMFSLDG
eukprot:6180987-Pleurochrysis_carterae.AAC.2